jgi:transposase
VFCEFVRRFPSLQDAQAADDETIIAFFKEHNVHRLDLIRERIAAIRSETALTDDTATVESSLMVVRSCIEQLAVLIASVHTFDIRIAALMKANSDSEIFQSLPAAGPTMAPRLVVAFGEDREQFKDAASMQRAAGVAPVTESSGNQHWVHWRWACSTFLRQTFVEWTALTIPRSFWAKAYYQQRRAKGSSHNAAIRALAFKWIRILHRLWVDRVPYDESKHLLSLQRRNPELLKFAASQPSFS